MTRIFSATLFALSISIVAVGQIKSPGNMSSAADSVKASPAYAEVLLRKTELESELESLLIDFTNDYPKVVDIRMELELLKIESDRLLTLKPADTGKLTLALGKLVLGKVSHAAALRRLQTQYQDGHPNVKKEKRQVEIFEAAIKEILG